MSIESRSMDEQVRKVLAELYGVAQDMHSHLSCMTSVAETQRFMPPILAAAELLGLTGSASSELKAPT